MRWTVVFKNGDAERGHADPRSFDRQFRGRRLPPVCHILMPIAADPGLERYLRDEILAPAAAGWTP